MINKIQFKIFISQTADSIILKIYVSASALKYSEEHYNGALSLLYLVILFYMNHLRADCSQSNNKIMRLYKTTNHKYRLLFSKPGMNKQTTLCNSLFSTMKGFITFSVALEKYN